MFRTTEITMGLLLDLVMPSSALIVDTSNMMFWYKVCQIYSPKGFSILPVSNILSGFFICHFHCLQCMSCLTSLTSQSLTNVYQFQVIGATLVSLSVMGISLSDKIYDRLLECFGRPNRSYYEEIGGVQDCNKCPEPNECSRLRQFS